MIDVITPFREKRKEISSNIPYVLDILESGTKKAQEVTNATLMEVKKAMGINYDDDFKREQIEKYKNSWQIKKIIVKLCYYFWCWREFMSKSYKHNYIISLFNNEMTNCAIKEIL